NGSGGYVRTYLAVYRPTGLSFDSAGNLYIAGEDPNNSYTAFDGRIRFLKAGDELISRNYTGGGLDDISRVEGSVAVRPDGAIVFSDFLGSRLAKTDAAFTAPASGLDIHASGTGLVFTWKTAQPSPSSVRY